MPSKTESSHCNTSLTTSNTFVSFDCDSSFFVQHLIFIINDVSDLGWYNQNTFVLIGVTDTPITQATGPPAKYMLCAYYNIIGREDTLVPCQPLPVSGQFLFIRLILSSKDVLRLVEVGVYSGIFCLIRHIHLPILGTLCT